MLARFSMTALFILSLSLAACAPSPAATLAVGPTATLTATTVVPPTPLPSLTPTSAPPTAIPTLAAPTQTLSPLPADGARLATGGSTHSCAGSSQGIFCWGANDNGQLGDGTQTSSWTTPVLVKALPGPVMALFAGSYHTCALVTGEVWCWGKNDEGQLGDGTTHDHATPVKVEGLSNVLSISAGFTHTCALVAGGRVLCWGANQSGQIDKDAPEQVLLPAEAYAAGGNARQVTAASMFTCSLSIDNIATCWGDDSSGLLSGTLASTKARVEIKDMPEGVVELAARGYLLCALTGSGEMWCRGSGWSPDTDPDQFIQARLSGQVAQMSVADGTMCALLADGTVWCWGDNYFNELDTGDGINSAEPVKIKSVDSRALMIGSGSEHFLALLEDGRVVGWGDTSFGAPGDGSFRWK